MDDEPLLWNIVYRTVHRVARRHSSLGRRVGRPDRYPTTQILLIWLLSALWDLPLSRLMPQLKSWRWRRAMRSIGWLLPIPLPHRTTVLRRAWRADFAELLEEVNLELIRHLGPDWVQWVLDSTPLPVPTISHDKQARWGHHKLFGYRLHTLLSGDGVVLVEQLEGANVHELKVAPELVRRLARSPVMTGRRRIAVPRFVSADIGYDSEPLHRCIRCQLSGARLVAPFNDRGGKRTMQNTPLRRALYSCWRTPAIRAVRRRRSVIERTYSRLKSGRFRLHALPAFVRHKECVSRWTKLKTVLYHADMLLKRRKNRRE